MLVSDRRREILHRLLDDGYVDARALAAELDVDASTIRRDLEALARDGQVQRTHGGARPVPGTPVDMPYALKRSERRPEKVDIAVEAAALVQDGDTVILDSGSTTYELAVALRRRQGLTVITNDLRIGKSLATMPRTRLLVTGGELIGSVYTLAGEHALDFLSRYSADWAFLGADAIDVDAGITNTNIQEIPLKRAMIAAATKAVVLADHSKFLHRTLAKVASIDEISLIVADAGLSEPVAKSYGTRLVRAARDSAATSAP